MSRSACFHARGALSMPAPRDVPGPWGEGGLSVDEEEWLACADLSRMLAFLSGRTSDRKLRLFAVACVRLVWRLVRRERTQYRPL